MQHQSSPYLHVGLPIKCTRSYTTNILPPFDTIAIYSCPISPPLVTPANPSELNMPPLSTEEYDQTVPSTIKYDQMASSPLQLTASTYITTQVPNNSEIDRNPSLWIIIAIVAGVVLIMTCTCVLTLAIFTCKKRVQQGKNGQLHIQDEFSYEMSVKSYQSSISVKLKVRIATNKTVVQFLP